jgi:hypothetical protein
MNKNASKTTRFTTAVIEHLKTLRRPELLIRLFSDSHGLNAEFPRLASDIYSANAKLLKSRSPPAT